MKNIKEYLKTIGMSKQELANEIKLSRPTLDAYISLFENGEVIPRDRYQIIFEELFEHELKVDDFKMTLQRLKGLLDRDERLGTDKLDASAADMISRLKDRMFTDMSLGDWNQSVYIFIDMLITSYRHNEIFEKLAEYFTYLNRSELNDIVHDSQVPYFARFYKTFNSLLKDAISYQQEDYDAFMKRREDVIKSRIDEQQKKEDAIKKLITDTAKELKETGIEATEAEILKAVLDKIQK